MNMMACRPRWENWINSFYIFAWTSSNVRKLMRYIGEKLTRSYWKACLCAKAQSGRRLMCMVVRVTSAQFKKKSDVQRRYWTEKWLVHFAHDRAPHLNAAMVPKVLQYMVVVSQYQIRLIWKYVTI
jgi:hypothetical protein